LNRQLAQEQIVDHEQLRVLHLRAELAELADLAELARFVDVFDQLMGFAVGDFVATADGSERERLGDVALAGAGRSRDILPGIRSSVKYRSITLREAALLKGQLLLAAKLNFQRETLRRFTNHS
jgi:hypothetical protein